MIKIAAAILLFGLTSCTKFGKTVTLKGRVLNPITGKGIEGAEIWLQRSAGGIPGGNKTVKTAKSDSEGYFEVSKAGLRNYTAICVLDESYYKMGWQTDGTGKQLGDVQVENITVGKKKSVDFYAVKTGKYTVVVKNVNCSGASDKVIITRTNQINSFLNVDWILEGCADKTVSSVAPQGKVYTTYTVIRNGVSTVFNTTFDILPGIENIQTIYY